MAWTRSERKAPVSASPGGNPAGTTPRRRIARATAGTATRGVEEGLWRQHAVRAERAGSAGFGPTLNAGHRAHGAGLHGVGHSPEVAATGSDSLPPALLQACMRTHTQYASSNCSASTAPSPPPSPKRQETTSDKSARPRGVRTVWRRRLWAAAGAAFEAARVFPGHRRGVSAWRASPNGPARRRNGGGGATAGRTVREAPLARGDGARSKAHGNGFSLRGGLRHAQRHAAARGGAVGMERRPGSLPAAGKASRPSNEAPRSASNGGPARAPTPAQPNPRPPFTQTTAAHTSADKRCSSVRMG